MILHMIDFIEHAYKHDVQCCCHDVILDCQNLLSISVTSVGNTILSRWLGGDLGFHVCHSGLC